MAVRIRGSTAEDAATTTVDQWDRLVNAMLAAAVRYGELDERHRKRTAWLAENQGDPRWLERKRQTHEAWQQRNQAAVHMMNLAEGVGRCQACLPAGSRAGLGALLGLDLTPYLGNRLAMTAARLGSTDLFAVAFQVLADLRAEDEADGHAIGDGLGEETDAPERSA